MRIESTLGWGSLRGGAGAAALGACGKITPLVSAELALSRAFASLAGGGDGTNSGLGVMAGELDTVVDGFGDCAGWLGRG